MAKAEEAAAYEMTQVNRPPVQTQQPPLIPYGTNPQPGVDYGAPPPSSLPLAPDQDQGSIGGGSSVFNYATTPGGQLFGNVPYYSPKFQQDQINAALYEEYGGQRPPHYLIMSWIMIFCNPICGIPALIMSYSSRRAHDRGEVEQAVTNGKLALALCASALFSGGVIYVFLLLYVTIFKVVIFNPYENEGNI